MIRESTSTNLATEARRHRRVYWLGLIRGSVAPRPTYVRKRTRVRILSLTAGAASMYCGSCLRDNALAAELIRKGHDVTLLPFYTPTLTDEPNVSRQERIFFGGISVFLQQHVSLFRHTPQALDRLWDAPASDQSVHERIDCG